MPIPVLVMISTSIGRITMNDILQYSHAVELIKHAIEQSRYRASKSANAELLSLYYGIG